MWNSPMPIDSASVLKIKPYGENGLSFIQPSREVMRNLKFDGKDYPVLGRGVAEGSTSSARRVDARTLEITARIKGTIMRRDQMKAVTRPQDADQHAASGRSMTRTFSC